MIIFAITLLIFLISYRIERRNLWIGVAFIGFLFGLLALVWSSFSFQDYPILYMIIGFLFLVAFILIFILVGSSH